MLPDDPTPVHRSSEVPARISQAAHAFHDITRQKHSLVVFFIARETFVDGFEDGDVCRMKGPGFGEPENGDEFVAENFYFDSRKCRHRSR